MRAKWLVLLLALVLPASAQELSFSGTMGMDFLFAPSSPLSMQAALTLTMDVGKGGVTSHTTLSLSGLEAEHLWLWLNFQGVTLKTGLTFDPCFSRWSLSASGGCCPFFLGGWFFLGNLAPACQPPNYTIGVILDFGAGGRARLPRPQPHRLRRQGSGVLDRQRPLDRGHPRSGLVLRGRAPSIRLVCGLLATLYHMDVYLRRPWVRRAWG
jgi:hypothetical protein